MDILGVYMDILGAYKDILGAYKEGIGLQLAFELCARPHICMSVYACICVYTLSRVEGLGFGV